MLLNRHQQRLLSKIYDLFYFLCELSWWNSRQVLRKYLVGRGRVIELLESIFLLKLFSSALIIHSVCRINFHYYFLLLGDLLDLFLIIIVLIGHCSPSKLYRFDFLFFLIVIKYFIGSNINRGKLLHFTLMGFVRGAQARTVFINVRVLF